MKPLDTQEYEIFHDIAAIMDEARERWADLDETNTSDNFILYAMTYLGRGTSSHRNADIDRVDMLMKAAGLIIEAALAAGDE